MNKTNDNLTTPKQTKRLGLKRNNSVLKDSAEKTTGSTTILACKIKATLRRLPQSDVRIDYRNSESKERLVSNTPGTPKSSSELQRQSVSTNCRPYRLSLSKKMREKMTKKRLEFHLANEIEKDVEVNESRLDKDTSEKTIETNTCQGYIGKSKECDDTKDSFAEIIESECYVKDKETNIDCCLKILGNMTSQELMTQIETLRSDLTIRQDHAKKVQELQEAIDVWKNGFCSALSDLKQKIETRLDTKTILDQLKIPQEMLKYVND